MNARRRKIQLFSLWTAGGALIASINVDMFGTGNIDWATFRYEWVKCALGVIISVTGALKALDSDPNGDKIVNLEEAKKSIKNLTDLTNKPETEYAKATSSTRPETIPRTRTGSGSPSSGAEGTSTRGESSDNQG